MNSAYPKIYYLTHSAGISNSQLYKQASNSLTVPVICEIAKRLAVLN